MIPIILNDTNYIKTNALLNTRSDATLSKSDIIKKLRPKGHFKIFQIIDAISKISELESKQVSFKVLFKSHPNVIDI